MQNLRAAKAQRDDVFGSQFFLVPGTNSLLCRKREYVDQLGKWAAFLAQQGMVNGLTESDQNTKS